MNQDRWTRRSVLSLLAASTLTSTGWTQSEKFPTRRVTLTVPYGAGSTNDIFARIVAEGLTAQLGQSVIVENKPGAGGTLGIGQVTRAPADGYTLALISTSSIPINRALYKSLSYDPVRDLFPVGIPCTTPNALIVSADQNINTVAELVTKAKTMSPPRYNSAGSGTSQHLSGVLFSRLTGINAEHVPYRGQEGITGMMGGQTLFGFASIPSVVGLVRAGKLKILAVSGSKPSSAFPDVPTLVSLGFPDFSYGEIWYGVATPSATPAPVKKTLTEAMTAVAAKPDIRERLSKAGFDLAAPMNDEERKKFVDKQVVFWGDLVSASGAKAD
ncbi:MAG: Bug family tripartite tricarboxylate transporter substrate binding protein [Variibacter sp.]